MSCPAWSRDQAMNVLANRRESKRQVIPNAVLRSLHLSLIQPPTDVTEATTPTVIRPMSIEYSSSEAPRSSFQSLTATSFTLLRIRRTPHTRIGTEMDPAAPTPADASQNSIINRMSTSCRKQTVCPQTPMPQDATAPLQTSSSRAASVPQRRISVQHTKEHARSRFCRCSTRRLNRLREILTLASRQRLTESEEVGKLLRGGNVTTRRKRRKHGSCMSALRLPSALACRVSLSHAWCDSNLSC